MQWSEKILQRSWAKLYNLNMSDQHALATYNWRLPKEYVGRQGVWSYRYNSTPLYGSAQQYRHWL